MTEATNASPDWADVPNTHDGVFRSCSDEYDDDDDGGVDVRGGAALEFGNQVLDAASLLPHVLWDVGHSLASIMPMEEELEMCAPCACATTSSSSSSSLPDRLVLMQRLRAMEARTVMGIIYFTAPKHTTTSAHNLDEDVGVGVGVGVPIQHAHVSLNMMNGFHVIDGCPSSVTPMTNDGYESMLALVLHGLLPPTTAE